MSRYPGAEAAARLGWWRSHRFLLLRRLCQFGVLTLFLLGRWRASGSSGQPLPARCCWRRCPHGSPDPAAVVGGRPSGPSPPCAQGWAGARRVTGWSGAGVLLLVCPVNLVTDAAAWLRGRLGLKGNGRFNRATRYWLLAMVLVAPSIAGVLVWELVNPVSLTLRGLLFGMGQAGACWRRCSCSTFLWWAGLVRPPLSGGAFYALVNRVGFIKIAASGARRCSNCMDYAVCRSVPSCAAPFTVPGVVTAPDCSQSVPTAAVASMSARNKF